MTSHPPQCVKTTFCASTSNPQSSHCRVTKKPVGHSAPPRSHTRTCSTHWTKRLYEHGTFHFRSFTRPRHVLLHTTKRPWFHPLWKTALLCQNVSIFQTWDPNMFCSVRHIDRVWSFCSQRNLHDHVTCETCLSVLTLWSVNWHSKRPKISPHSKKKQQPKTKTTVNQNKLKTKNPEPLDLIQQLLLQAGQICLQLHVLRLPRLFLGERWLCSSWECRARRAPLPQCRPASSPVPPLHDQHFGNVQRRGLLRRSDARVATTSAGVAPCGSRAAPACSANDTANR